MPESYGTTITTPSYELRSPPNVGEGSTYFSSTSVAASHHPPSGVPYPVDDGGFTMGDYKDLPPHERPGYDPSKAMFPPTPMDDDDLAYGDHSAVNGENSRHPSHGHIYPPGPEYPGYNNAETAMPSYKYTPRAVTGDSRSSSYTYGYAQPPDKFTYTMKPIGASGAVQHTQMPIGKYHEQPLRTLGQQSFNGDAHIVGITPGHEKRHRTSSASKHHRSSLSTEQPGLKSPGLGARMDRLSVSCNRPDLRALGGGGSLPPPSPLMEAYHGTWQSISPMPLAMRPADDDDLSDLELLSSSVPRSGNKKPSRLEHDAEREKDKKRVKLYNAEDDAKKIAGALNHRKIDADPIIDVLPGLSHDQIWALRKEYKKQVKIQGKGINLPKHLKMKLTGNFGKAAYVTALGRWESEGYWANFWYQSHGSRRELLIESLMGRTNAEIRDIKDEFKDKRYADSLVKCMEKELKMDKFRTAVLMALEERRQEEQDVYPIEYRNRDVDTLHRALTAQQGGESAMLEIILRRSDAHLKEVLKTYERMYQENFARAALRKSNNLVGEVIAHILNGVINKPARDAILLEHAIRDIAAHNKDDELRYELLVSRLVRLHWDKPHLVRVKRAYADKYRKELQREIEEATRGEFREFMCELAETR